jgi:hypothetical protein
MLWTVHKDWTWEVLDFWTEYWSWASTTNFDCSLHCGIFWDDTTFWWRKLQNIARQMYNYKLLVLVWTATLHKHENENAITTKLKAWIMYQQEAVTGAQPESLPTNLHFSCLWTFLRITLQYSRQNSLNFLLNLWNKYLVCFLPQRFFFLTQRWKIVCNIKELNIVMDLGEVASSNAKYINCLKFIHN